MKDLKKEHERNVIARLDAPDPTNRDLAGVLKLMLEKMWDEKRLAEFVTAQHNALCTHCQARGGRVSWKLASGLIALATSLAGTVAYLVRALFE